MDTESEFRLVDALVDDLDRLTPEELEEELAESGMDPQRFGAGVTDVLLRGVRNHYLRQRLELAQELSSTSRQRQRLSSRLGLEELREAIHQKLALLSPQQQRLTLCHRDLRELTVEDLRSTLEDLEELTEDDDESP